VEAGKLALETRPFPVRECVQGVEKLLRWRADEKGLVFECKVAEGTPAWLEGDAGRIRQILLNLAGNAIKFTESGHVKLEVSATEADDGGHELTFLVEDSGIGIAAAELPRIFEPFTQLDGSMRRARGGTGLGLTISSRLAERMGGKISAESRLGEGSRFYFRVRLLAAAPPERALEAASLPSRRLRILLAEDNRINQRIATRMLEELGHQVECVANGHQAVSHAKAFAYDLIFMDIQMPELDGYSATRAIRELPSPVAQTPIVALTAHAMTGDRENCLAAGMDDYVSKPVSLEALRDAVRRSISERATPSS
jgi:CheY-like chemotaxis protein